MSYTSDNLPKSGFPMLDMMMQMQRLSLKAMSIYQPLVSTFLDVASSAEPARRASAFGAARARSSGLRESDGADEEQVIGVGEEVLNIGTRMVPGKTTRVRRVVVQNPVQQDVTLHTETVVLERRKPVLTSGNDVLTEVTIEMSDFNEIPIVSKSVHLVEEVLLRKEITSHIETIHETVRRDTLQIEQPSNLPVVVPVAAKPDVKKRETVAAGEMAEKPAADPSQSDSASQTATKPGDQKRS